MEEIKQFSECPKYIKHDISEAQMIEIATIAVELATEKAKLELAENVLALGQDIIGKFFIGVGAAALAAIAWIQAHELIKF